MWTCMCICMYLNDMYVCICNVCGCVYTLCVSLMSSFTNVFLDFILGFFLLYNYWNTLTVLGHFTTTSSEKMGVTALLCHLKTSEMLLECWYNNTSYLQSHNWLQMMVFVLFMWSYYEAVFQIEIVQQTLKMSRTAHRRCPCTAIKGFTVSSGCCVHLTASSLSKGIFVQLYRNYWMRENHFASLFSYWQPVLLKAWQSL